MAYFVNSFPATFSPVESVGGIVHPTVNGTDILVGVHHPGGDHHRRMPLFAEFSYEALAGSRRTGAVVPQVESKSGGTQKAEWTIQGKKGSKVTIAAGAPNLDPVSTTIVLQ